MVGTICENAGFGPGVKERGRYNVLPASIVKFTVIFVMMQRETVTRTTEAEATTVPVSQDTNGTKDPTGMDSLVQVCK